jgi:hypothetical protein
VLRGTFYATHLGSPSHQVSPLPLVAQSALSDETATPLRGLCKSCQAPLDTGASLSRKITRNGWKPTLWYPTCATRNQSTCQQRQEPGKAAFASRLEAFSAEPLAAAAAGARPEYAGDAASAGGVPAAAASAPSMYT